MLVGVNDYLRRTICVQSPSPEIFLTGLRLRLVDMRDAIWLVFSTRRSWETQLDATVVVTGWFKFDFACLLYLRVHLHRVSRDGGKWRHHDEPAHRTS